MKIFLSEVKLFILLTMCSNISLICGEVLLEKLEQALVNDTENLLALQTLFYPPDHFQTSSVSISVSQCGLTVNNITNDSSHLCQQSLSSESCEGCSHSPGYCLNTSSALYFQLSDGSNVKSYSKLVNYITTGDPSFAAYLSVIDYISFSLFNLLTHYPLNSSEQTHVDNTISLSFHLDELEEILSFDDVVTNLQLLLSWVSL